MRFERCRVTWERLVYSHMYVWCVSKHRHNNILGVFGSILGAFGIVWKRFGCVWTRLGMFWSVLERLNTV